MKRYAKKRTGRRDMDVRSVFAEIFECADATRSFLKFVEEDQCLSSLDLYAGMGFKDEKEFVRLSAEKLRGKFSGLDIRKDCFVGHDLTTPLGNIKFVLASHQHGFDVTTNDNGWPVYRSDFDASYSWELVLEEWFLAVASTLEDGSEIEVYPDEGHWGYEVRGGVVV